MGQRFYLHLCPMDRTAFTNKFKPVSEGRMLQQAIHTLEDDIIAAEKASLTLDIEGYHVFTSDGMEIEEGEDRHLTGAYYDNTPDILYKIGLKKTILKALNAQTIRWKAQLVDKYSEYQKFLNK